MMLFEAEAFIHSLNEGALQSTKMATVKILEHTDNNNCVAEYNGKTCKAVFNPFVNRYYVDDVYGVIQDKNKKNPERER